MRITYKGNNIAIGDQLKAKVEKKLVKLEKYFKDDIQVRVNLSQLKNQAIAEITVFLPGHILRAEEVTEDIIQSVDEAVDAILRQVRKFKTKLKKRYNNGETIRFESFEETDDKVKEEELHGIVKTKKFDLKPMTAEEAILQMEMLGHNFFLFREGESGDVQLVYKRKEGNYGLIES